MCLVFPLVDMFLEEYNQANNLLIVKEFHLFIEYNLNKVSITKITCVRFIAGWTTIPFTNVSITMLVWWAWRQRSFGCWNIPWPTNPENFVKFIFVVINCLTNTFIVHSFRSKWTFCPVDYNTFITFMNIYFTLATNTRRKLTFTTFIFFFE